MHDESAAKALLRHAGFSEEEIERFVNEYHK